MSKLVIRRLAANQEPSLTVECAPGAITVLADSEGALIGSYLAALSGQPLDRFVLEIDERPTSAKEFLRVGFGEKLPPCKMAEYFTHSGYPAHEVDALIRAYDLEKSAFFPCSQLPATATRQLILLSALRKDSQVLVLNDPFMPFNGRWREYFAEKLLQLAQDRGIIIIVLNLSFTPQCWLQAERVSFLDLGKLLRGEVERIREREGRKAPSEKKLDDLDPVKLENQMKATIRIPIPENLVFAFSEVHDFIFEPLARASTLLRRYSGPVVLLGGACVMLLMAIIMFPNIGHYQAMLRDVASRLTELPSESTPSHGGAPPPTDHHSRAQESVENPTVTSGEIEETDEIGWHVEDSSSEEQSEQDHDSFERESYALNSATLEEQQAELCPLQMDNIPPLCLVK